MHLLIVMKRSTETNGSKKPCLLNLDKYPQASMTPLSFCSIAHIYARSQPKELPDAPVQSCYFEFANLHLREKMEKTGIRAPRVRLVETVQEERQGSQDRWVLPGSRG